jgi:hypothetical protein
MEGIMVQKSWKVFVGVVTGALFLMATVAFAAGAPDKADLSKYKGTKSAVSLDHKMHVDAKIPCATCHHKAKDGKTVACGECHKKDADGATPSIKDSFHKTCKGCHDKAKKDKADSKAPTKCGECHK